MNKNEHLVIILYSTFDEKAVAIEFEHEHQLCNYFHEINDEIELEYALIFEFDTIDGEIKIRTADKTKFPFDYSSHILTTVQDALFND